MKRSKIITISAEIIKDSVSEDGVRLTTFLLIYPRFIHSEVLSHRVFSRNSASSRAVPSHKNIESVRKNPVYPLRYTSNQKGMVGGEELPEDNIKIIKKVWEVMVGATTTAASILDKEGLHKQYSNRILEPLSTITVVLSSTTWDNFFDLRIHEAAQPEICELATQMKDCLEYNVPTIVKMSEWHTPFVTEDDIENLSKEDLIKRSVARCARVSYKNHDKTDTTLEQDQKLYDRLRTSKHFSPFEHIATPASSALTSSGNFTGWVQYRKLIGG